MEFCILLSLLYGRWAPNEFGVRCHFLQSWGGITPCSALIFKQKILFHKQKERIWKCGNPTKGLCVIYMFAKFTSLECPSYNEFSVVGYSCKLREKSFLFWLCLWFANRKHSILLYDYNSTTLSFCCSCLVAMSERQSIWYIGSALAAHSVICTFLIKVQKGNRGHAILIACHTDLSILQLVWDSHHNGPFNCEHLK